MYIPMLSLSVHSLKHNHVQLRMVRIMLIPMPEMFLCTLQLFQMSHENKESLGLCRSTSILCLLMAWGVHATRVTSSSLKYCVRDTRPDDIVLTQGQPVSWATSEAAISEAATSEAAASEAATSEAFQVCWITWPGVRCHVLWHRARRPNHKKREAIF